MFEGSMDHLFGQLGDERLAVLVDSGNIEEVKEFCDDLIRDAVFKKLAIGDRIYEVLKPSCGVNKSVKVGSMIDLAIEMNANLGREDGQHLLDHQADIPAAFRNKVEFVFTDWIEGWSVLTMNSVRWYDDYWSISSASLGCSKILDRCRFLRRIK